MKKEKGMPPSTLRIIAENNSRKAVLPAIIIVGMSYFMPSPWAGFGCAVLGFIAGYSFALWALAWYAEQTESEAGEGEE